VGGEERARRRAELEPLYVEALACEQNGLIGLRIKWEIMKIMKIMEKGDNEDNEDGR